MSENAYMLSRIQRLELRIAEQAARIRELEALVAGGDDQATRDDEARKAADRVEALPYRDHGRTVNRNEAIMAARRGLPR